MQRLFVCLPARRAKHAAMLDHSRDDEGTLIAKQAARKPAKNEICTSRPCIPGASGGVLFSLSDHHAAAIKKA